MRQPSREEGSQTNFVVASIFSPLFQVYFEASNATGVCVYKLRYECTNHTPGLRQIYNFSSVLLAHFFQFPTVGVPGLILAQDRYGIMFTSYWNVPHVLMYNTLAHMGTTAEQ